MLIIYVKINVAINYTEAHHLIPLEFQDEFKHSLDVPENIVSLCSSCHREIHHGKNAEAIIKKLFYKRNAILKKAKLRIELEDLLKKYKLI